MKVLRTNREQKSSNSLNDTIVGECDSVQIVVLPLSKGAPINATAPFYIISYELGGISSTDFIGSDPNNLTWVVKHPQGEFSSQIAAFGW